MLIQGPDPATVEARERAAGVKVFTIHVGRDGAKWVGQCQEIDVAVTMPSEDLMRSTVRWAIMNVLDYHVPRHRVRFVS